MSSGSLTLVDQVIDPDGNFLAKYTVKTLLENLHRELPNLPSASQQSHRRHSLGSSRRILGRCAQLMGVETRGRAKDGGYHFAPF